MRVLQLINALSAGGAESFVAQLTQALKKHCEVKLLTYAGAVDEKGKWLRDQLNEAGMLHLDAGATTHARRLTVPLWLARHIRQFQPDIVHVHLPRMEQFAMLSSLLVAHNPIFIRTKHDSRPIQANFQTTAATMRFSAHVACSQASLDQLKFAGLHDRSHLLLNGTVLAPIKDRTQLRKQARDSLGLLPEDRLGLCIGRIEKTPSGFLKGQEAVVEAMSAPDVAGKLHIVFVGGGSGLNELKSMAASSCARSCMHFTGVVADVSPYLAAADFMLMPSPNEGLPMSAIECACAGLPLLLSDIPAFDIFKRSSTLFCRPGDSASLRNKLINMMDHIEAMKESAAIESKHYSETFSVDNVAKSHIALYNMLVERRHTDRLRTGR